MTERPGICGNEGSYQDRAHSPNLPFNPMYSYSMNRRIGMDWEGFIADSTLSQEPSLKMSRVNRPALCFAFAEENPSWMINVPPGGREDLLHHFYRKGDAGPYSGASMGKNDLWMYANKNLPNSPISNFATYHGVGSNRRDEGKANVLFVDSHIKLTRGLPGYAAYLEYARPYWGQELLNIW
jgi:prepilin-type processing-associated H-X9-DG protein